MGREGPIGICRHILGYDRHMGSILFGDTMVPIIEQDNILLLGYSILYKEYNLTGFNHQKNATHIVFLLMPGAPVNGLTPLSECWVEFQDPRV